MLFEGGDEILATFGDRLSGKATKELEKVGVEIHVKSRVTDVTEDAIKVQADDGETAYPCRTKVWAAGVTAPPLARDLADAAGAEVDRAGRIKVLPGLHAAGPSGGVRRRRRHVARPPAWRRRGRHADRDLRRRDDQASRRTATPRRAPFKYRDLGSMATVARFRAIVDFKGIRVAGFIGWIMWAFVHLTFLTGYKNRFFAGIGWVLSFLGKARPERPISWTAAKQ